MIRISYRALDLEWDLKTVLKQALDMPNLLVYIDEPMYSWLTPEIKLTENRLLTLSIEKK